MEEALRGLELSEDTPEGLTDMRRAEMDVFYCCIAYTLGDNAEGNSLRRRVEANPYASTPDGEYLRIPCLLMAGRYDEAMAGTTSSPSLAEEVGLPSEDISTLTTTSPTPAVTSQSTT